MSETRELPETVITPIAGWEHIDPRKVWEFRSLFASMVWRDVRVKFDALHLGFLWSTARPLMMVLVVTVFRGIHEGERLAGLPYALFLYTGLVFWFYFSDSLHESAMAVQRDAGVISKVFYPRIISPMVAVTANLVDLGVGLLPVVGFLWHFGIMPNGWFFALPIVVLTLAMLALGGGMLFARLILVVRDFERVLQMALYIGLFASPVFHAMETVPERFMPLIHLNPTTGALLAARGCFAGGAEPFPLVAMLISFGIAVASVVVGAWAFRNMQDRLLERL